ncbi:MAG: hypothetical protein IMZ55_04880 [Acidobacteria bacterium]|nr:hypothetical protein [Acidobacteriota bacterium]
MAETDAATIAALAAQPRSASADGVSASQHPLADQIAALRFATAARITDPSRCLRRFKIVPSGGREA